MHPATYFVPHNLEHALRNIGETFSMLNESFDGRGSIHTSAVAPDSDPIEVKLTFFFGSILLIDHFCFQLPNGYCVKVFATHHRVPSQGYIVYRLKKRRKPEYQNFTSDEMKELVKNKVDFMTISEVPILAYTGRYYSLIFFSWS
jgi:ribonuclease Z